jgi:antitoxin (DNA-binding transcriptional repressor) of toxin-antitoxin stability system
MGATMKHIGITQAREDLPGLVHRAEAGEEIVIARQGRAVKRLVAAPCTPRALPAAAGVPSLARHRRQQP